MGLDRTFTELDAKLKHPPGLSPEEIKQWDAYYEPRNARFREAKPTGQELVRWRYNRYMHDYLGCVKAVDESVGKLLDYLQTEGLADNTIVVLASDQGFYLGEHGWFDKRWIFEESLRTPLLVRCPAYPPWQHFHRTGIAGRLCGNLFGYCWRTCSERNARQQPGTIAGREHP